MAGAAGCTTGAGEGEETGGSENEQPAMRADTISNGQSTDFFIKEPSFQYTFPL